MSRTLTFLASSALVLISLLVATPVGNAGIDPRLRCTWRPLEDGVNLRTGPGTHFPSAGHARKGFFYASENRPSCDHVPGGLYTACGRTGAHWAAVRTPQGVRYMAGYCTYRGNEGFVETGFPRSTQGGKPDRK